MRTTRSSVGGLQALALTLALVAQLGAGCSGSPNGRRKLPETDGGSDDASAEALDGDVVTTPHDLAVRRDLSVPLDGPSGSAYSNLGKSDSGLCAPPAMGATCAMPIAQTAGCIAVDLCGPSGHGNGVDDDCNGKVDDPCDCTPGEVERCFLGPPGKRGVGACSDGSQTCFGAEFGAWGDCLGSRSPAPEACDSLDNDCNGCADDGLCCGGTLACPASVPDVNPYTDVAYDGAAWYTGAARSWTWAVAGGPCDRLFAATTNPVTQSFTVANGAAHNPTVHYTLSGDYTITMTAVGADGTTNTCTFVQHVAGPGVRFELCWDHTGDSASGGADLDLHVHRPGTTTKWFGSMNSPNTDDCNFNDCVVDNYSLLGALNPNANWGYATTPLANCVGAPAGVLADWMQVGACHDPRLDIDNVSTVGRPENTNIDNPKQGDSFRALVHYYGQDGDVSTGPVEEHPIVNVYCGGVLTASFGQAPNQLSGFNTGTGWAKGQMWRVADVVAQVNAAGVTTGCTVTALHPNGAMSGYDITVGNTSY